MDRGDKDHPDRSGREGKGSKGKGYKGDNSGGYGNPPVRGQFAKGNKLGGRKKGVTNLETEIRKLLGRKVAIKTEGEPLFMLPKEILAQRIMSAVLSEKSSPAMIDYARKLFDEFGPKEVETVPRLMDSAGLSHDERAILAELLKRVVKECAESPVSATSQSYIDSIAGIYEIRRGDDGHIVIERV